MVTGMHEAFHVIGDSARTILRDDGTILAKSFPVRKENDGSSQLYKSLTFKISEDRAGCSLCDETYKCDKTRNWNRQSHLIHHHPECCSIKELKEHNTVFIRNKIDVWNRALKPPQESLSSVGGSIYF